MDMQFNELSNKTSYICIEIKQKDILINQRSTK